MTANQETQNKKKIKTIITRFFNLKQKANDLTREEWERIEMRKPTIRVNSHRECI